MSRALFLSNRRMSPGNIFVSSEAGQTPNLLSPILSIAVALFAAIPFISLAQSCTTMPPGLVAWWPGDNDTNDLVGTNIATLQNSTTFSPAEVDFGFSLDGF